MLEQPVDEEITPRLLIRRQVNRQRLGLGVLVPLPQILLGGVLAKLPSDDVVEIGVGLTSSCQDWFWGGSADLFVFV